MATKRLLWIDILKGIGIISIIFAHTTEHKSVFIYAVPLFFMISGYLHHPVENLMSFLKKSAQRMIIPYFVFFLIISFVHVVLSDNPWTTLMVHIDLLIGGGNSMTRDLGVFWFVNVMFLGLNIFNYLRVKQIPLFIYFLLFLISNGLFLFNINLPWNIQSLPLALSYMFIGSVLSKYCNNMQIKKGLIYICILYLFTVICIPNIFLDIKNNNYGIPFLSFLLSIIAFIALFIVSLKLEGIKPISKFLAYCGKASLFLMFIHQFIHFRLLFINNKYVLFSVTVLLSLCFYYLVSKSHLGRIFLCGEIKKRVQH